MQVSKLIIVALALGTIVYSSKANATDLSSTVPIQLEFNLQLAQLNLQDAAIYLNQGIKLLEQGDYQEAIAYFTKAIENNPKLVAAYYNRAIARHQLQEYQRAIANFTKVIKFNPSDAKSYIKDDYA
ncbi:MAG: tetratricopeptide repeat protein [Rivularia sp. (in: cyanobacteria)]